MREISTKLTSNNKKIKNQSIIMSTLPPNHWIFKIRHPIQYNLSPYTIFITAKHISTKLTVTDQKNKEIKELSRRKTHQIAGSSTDSIESNTKSQKPKDSKKKNQN